MLQNFSGPTNICFTVDKKLLGPKSTNNNSSEVCYSNLSTVQNQTSLILTFDASDTVATTGTQSDLASFAAIGCNGLSVLTGNTFLIDEIHPLDANLVNNQAHTILEDMEIVTVKVVQVGSVENAIAEIVSDYPTMSLLLDPFKSSLPDFESENGDRLLAIRELIISQATLLLISAVDLIRLAETGKEPEASDATIESDCEYVLVTGIPEQGIDVTNTLFNDAGIVRHDQRQRIPSLHTDTGDTLSTGITAALANGLAMSDIVPEAQEFTLASMRHAHTWNGKAHPGSPFLGQRA